jgi:hypothetical protein
VLVHYKSAEGRNGTCIGYNADSLYETKLAHAAIHSLDPERHMVKLSKEAVELFGHSFSDGGLFCVIDGAQRKRLLLGVSAPCRRALRRIMAAEAKNRAVAREEGGGEADDAGFQAALNEQMEKVKLAAGRKPRKKEVEAALARERIAPGRQ